MPLRGPVPSGGGSGGEGGGGSGGGSSGADEQPLPLYYWAGGPSPSSSWPAPAAPCSSTA